MSNPMIPKCPVSEVPRLGRRRFPVVVASVDIGHGRTGELDGIDLVEGGQADGVESGSRVLDVGLPEGAYAAGLAEAVMDAPGAELVVAQVGCAREQAHVGRPPRHQPRSLLRADRAVALD